jgi:hypothetical protein
MKVRIPKHVRRIRMAVEVIPSPLGEGKGEGKGTGFDRYRASATSLKKVYTNREGQVSID